MMVCADCKETFDTPKEDYVIEEFWGAMVRHTYYVCPHCGSEDIEEAEEESEE